MLLDVGNTWHYVQRANEPGAPLVTLSRTITEHRQIDHNGQAITVSVEMPVVETSAKIQLWLGEPGGHNALQQSPTGGAIGGPYWTESRYGWRPIHGLCRC